MNKAQRNRGYEHDGQWYDPPNSRNHRQQTEDLVTDNKQRVCRELHDRSKSRQTKAESLDDSEKSNYIYRQQMGHSINDRQQRYSRQPVRQPFEDNERRNSHQQRAQSREDYGQQDLRQAHGQTFDYDHRGSRQTIPWPFEYREQRSPSQQTRKTIYDYQPAILRQQHAQPFQDYEPAIVRHHSEHSLQDYKLNNSYYANRTNVNVPMQDMRAPTSQDSVQPYNITTGVPPVYDLGPQGYPATNYFSAAQYGQRQGHYYPDQNVGQYGHPVPHLLPAQQYIVRDEITPMPNDFEAAVPTEQPPFGLIIFKRIISVVFIILDVTPSWSIFSPDSLAEEAKEIVEQFKGKSGKLSLECSGDGDAILAAKTFFTAVSTIWAVFQIINMAGETLLEYHKQRKEEQSYPANVDHTDGNAGSKQHDNIASKFKSLFKGFQILHGWVETVVSMTCGDIPQVIVNIILGAKCSLGLESFGKTIPWMIFKSVKNGVRKETCKQKYKPCCPGECCSCKDCCKDCCVYVWDIPCICTVYTCRLCPTGQQQCCEIQKYEICPKNICQCRGDVCFGEIKEDPQWAYRLSLKLDELYFYLCVAAIVCTLLKHFNII